MSSPQPPASADAVRTLTQDVEALPGVEGVRVALGGEHEVTELHVRVGAEAAPAIVANAAGHVLRRRGYDFAPDAIRIVTGPPPRAAAPNPAAPDTAPDTAPTGARALPDQDARPAPPPARRRSDPGYSAQASAPPAPADPPQDGLELRRPRPRTRTTQETVSAPTPKSMPTPPPQREPGSRYLVLSDLSIARSASRVTCTVRVRRDGQLHDGTAAELDSETGRARAGARAALEASSQAVEGLAFGLAGAVLLEVFGRRHVAISVEAAAGRRVATLSGMVAVDPARSVEEAGALAALRAIERWIAW